MQSDFFNLVAATDIRVSLDKVCGFSKSTQEEDYNEQPWLMGTFTALSKSQFVSTADYANLLKWRLKKCRYLNIKKQIDNAIGSSVLNFFGKHPKKKTF